MKKLFVFIILAVLAAAMLLPSVARLSATRAYGLDKDSQTVQALNEYIKSDHQLTLNKNLNFGYDGLMQSQNYLKTNISNTHNSGFVSDIKMPCSILVDTSGVNVLFENNADEKRPVASIAKLMTIYIAMQEIEKGNLKLEDEILVSERAASMGGSQIFLDANTQHKCEDLIKAIIIASANDASVAIAERVSGSEASFVARMNETAKELGMNNTNYANTNGLPAPEGYSTARDTAILLAKLCKYEEYTKLSKIWMEDYVHPSGRITGMANTNKLVRFYPQTECGKTGSTVEAGYCLAASAKSNDTRLILVLLKAENSKQRFAYAQELFNYGFANFESKKIIDNNTLKDIKINIPYTGKTASVSVEKEYVETVRKNAEVNISYEISVNKSLRAVKKGQVVGNVKVIKNGGVVETINIISNETIKAPGFFKIFKRLLAG